MVTSALVRAARNNHIRHHLINSDPLFALSALKNIFKEGQKDSVLQFFFLAPMAISFTKAIRLQGRLSNFERQLNV